MVSLNKCDTTNYVNKRMGVCGKAENIVHLFLPNVCARVPNELELLSKNVPCNFFRRKFCQKTFLFFSRQLQLTR